MKILKWVLIFLAVIVLLAIGSLWYMGVFSSPKVAEAEFGPYTILYDTYVGPYMNTGKVFEKVYSALKGVSVESTDGLGIYYDDPSKVPADKLRSDCGAVISLKDLRKVYPLRKQFKVKTLPKRKSMIAEFPIRNAMSYAIGPMKGYPALMAHMKAKGYKPAIAYEFYDMKKNVILFIMEIKK